MVDFDSTAVTIRCDTPGCDRTFRHYIPALGDTDGSRWVAVRNARRGGWAVSEKDGIAVCPDHRLKSDVKGLLQGMFKKKGDK